MRQPVVPGLPQAFGPSRPHQRQCDGSEEARFSGAVVAEDHMPACALRSCERPPMRTQRSDVPDLDIADVHGGKGTNSTGVIIRPCDPETPSAWPSIRPEVWTELDRHRILDDEELLIGEGGISEQTARRLTLLSERASRELRAPQPAFARPASPSLLAGQVVGVVAVPGGERRIPAEVRSTRRCGSQSARAHAVRGLRTSCRGQSCLWHPGPPAPGIYRRWSIAATSIAFDIATFDIGHPDSVPKALREIIDGPDSIENSQVADEPLENMRSCKYIN